MNRAECRTLITRNAMVFWAEAKRIWPKQFHGMRMPTIRFDVQGLWAGWSNTDEWHIRLNVEMLSDEGKDAVWDTVGHELAHIVANTVYWRERAERRILGKRRQIHGHRWKEVMFAFGLDPNRCHNYKSARRARG